MRRLLSLFTKNESEADDDQADALLMQSLNHITAPAAFYDISQRAERNRSARDLQQLFYGLQRVLQPTLFLEAGAYDATASQKVRTLCPDAKIVALEANPYNHKALSEATDYREVGIDYLNLAASDSVGSISFKIQSSKGGEPIPLQSEKNSILARTEQGITYEEVNVASTTIDTQTESFDRISLWIDVEGASRQVLTGASASLSRTITALIEVEINPFWENQWLCLDVCRFMGSKGFIPVARDFEYWQQFNVLFIHRHTMKEPQVLKEIEYYHSQLVGKGFRKSVRSTARP